jgi:DNA-damage-inducible protein D
MLKKTKMTGNELIPFEGKEIRKLWHNEEWFFSVVDVIGILTDSEKPSQYWHNMKKRDTQLSPICLKLKLIGQDGKARPSDCANTEGVLRILMSVPSPKAEPFKLWLAQVGKERIEVSENPELLTQQQAELYRAKGYSEEWIGRRVQTIETRNELTAEWKARGIKEGQEYGILTATIAKGTFGLTPTEHSELKGLEKQNLRDHMTPLELILVALSEEVTRKITVRDEAQGFNENYEAAILGGQVGGKARQNVEEATGEKVVSAQNFLNLVGVKPNELPSGEGDERD